MTWQIICGDALAELRKMQDESVHCCVTSPPYYGLRSYSTMPQVWGGAPACEHVWGNEIPQDKRHAWNGQSGEKHSADGSFPTGRGCVCSICGAWRGELGLEPTPQLYVAHMVEVFAEVRRVLHRDGVCFANWGDSYAGSGRGGNPEVGTKQGTNAGSQTVGVLYGRDNASNWGTKTHPTLLPAYALWRLKRRVIT